MSIFVLAAFGVVAYAFMVYLLHLTVKFDRYVTELETHDERR